LLGSPLQITNVRPFYIDKTEVSNRAYLDFCRATGHTPPTGINQSPSENPVVNVAYDDARSFCSWANKRLPTATEWEKAARGSNGQLFPWGNSFDASLANVPRDKSAALTAKLAPVTAYVNGMSPYGALNMMGNVFEWVNAVATAPTGEEFRNYQQMFRDLSPPLAATDTFYFARGGSFTFPDQNPAELISDPGSPLPARARKPDVGFRCAMDPKN
jgi:formylglycine-generating enzyme required for sulfatase activity